MSNRFVRYWGKAGSMSVAGRRAGGSGQTVEALRANMAVSFHGFFQLAVVMFRLLHGRAIESES